MLKIVRARLGNSKVVKAVGSDKLPIAQQGRCPYLIIAINQGAIINNGCVDGIGIEYNAVTIKQRRIHKIVSSDCAVILKNSHLYMMNTPSDFTIYTIKNSYPDGVVIQNQAIFFMKQRRVDVAVAPDKTSRPIVIHHIEIAVWPGGQQC